ncbi:hypothetical protein [Streptomyces sp. NPDC020141]|uniref:hypothetical protein n=1 Tax=Streptomyces sp. NPDC020141 TaxID=3365065 RepID=UPI0037B8CC6E
MDHDIVEHQADITRLMLHHIHAPLALDQYLRGVLPAGVGVRVVTGPEGSHDPDELTAYEIPFDEDDLIPPSTVVGILRTLTTGTHIYPGDRVSTVLGMPVIRVEPSAVDPVAPSPDDDALTLLHCTAFSAEQPEPRLLGFLFTGEKRLRLYFAAEDRAEIVAADVRTSGALTALIAALPALITEEERLTPDDDPHCSRAMDLTYW